MRIASLDPRTDPIWETLLDEHRTCVFNSPAWLRVLSDTYNWDPRALVLFDDDERARAGLSFCRIGDIMGQRIVTLPFSDYCDPIAPDRDSWRRLVDRLTLDACPFAIRCLHNEVPLTDERFTLVKRAKWHGLDIGRDVGALWQDLDESTRRAIRKSEKDDLRVHMAARPEELRTFFEMHLGLRKYKYHMLAQPFRFFENIWRYFIETRNGWLLLASHQGRVVAGVLFLVWKDTLIYKFNASIPQDLCHRPNDRLIWEGIQQGKARGCTYFEFGLSDWDQDGLIRYKRKFGTEEKTISFLRCEPDGAGRHDDNGARELLAGLTALFVDRTVPDPVTERAGQDLYRYFT